MEIINSKIEAYLDNHLPSYDPLFDEIEKFTNEHTKVPQMLSGKYQARLLSFLAQFTPCQTIVEVGCFTGYVSLFLAANTSCKEVITLEKSPEYAKIAQSFFDKHPAGKKVKILVGDALENIAQLNNKKIDFVYIDADKANYQNYFNKLSPLLSERGLITADNILYSGMVTEEYPEENAARALKAFNTYLQTLSDFETVNLPVRDGLALVKRKS